MSAKDIERLARIVDPEGWGELDAWNETLARQGKPPLDTTSPSSLDRSISLVRAILLALRGTVIKTGNASVDEQWRHSVEYHLVPLIDHLLAE